MKKIRSGMREIAASAEILAICGNEYLKATKRFAMAFLSLEMPDLPPSSSQEDEDVDTAAADGWTVVAASDAKGGDEVVNDTGIFLELLNTSLVQRVEKERRLLITLDEGVASAFQAFANTDLEAIGARRGELDEARLIGHRHHAVLQPSGTPRPLQQLSAHVGIAEAARVDRSCAGD